MCHGQAVQIVSCGWDPSIDKNVAGYYFYYNTNSTDFTVRIDVGTNTTATTPNLLDGTTYYFAVTAYTSAGVESIPSGPIEFSTPTNATPVILPPVLGAIADQTISVGQSLVLTNSALDVSQPPPVLSFSLTAGPTGMQVDAVTGVISWMPSLAQAGSVSAVTVQVSDNSTPPLTASQSFSVSVGDAAQLSLSDTSVTIGQNGSVPLALSSSGAVTNLTFTLSTPAAWVGSVNVQSLLSGVSVSQTTIGPGQTLITVAAIHGQTLQGQVNLLQINFGTLAGQAAGAGLLQISNVTAILANGSPVPTTLAASAQITFVAPVIVPPVLEAIADQTASVGESLVVSIHANESNLAFSILTGPTGLQVDPFSGVISWTPSLAQAGSVNPVTVQVSDHSVPPLTAVQSFNVIVDDVAQIGLTNTSVTVGQSGSVPVTLFSSGAVTNLSFSLSAPAGWVNSISVQSLVDGFNVSQSSIGSAQTFITIAATNGQTLQGQLNLLQLNFTTTAGQEAGTGLLQISNVTAILVNGSPVPTTPDVAAQMTFLAPLALPPTLLPVADQMVNVGQGLVLTNYASATNLTFSLISGPAGMEINPVTGVLAWTPSLAQGGSVNAVTVQVSDHSAPPLTAIQFFNVIVGDVAQIGLINTSVTIGQSGSVPVTLFSSGAVTNLSFTLTAPAAWVNSVSVQSSMNDVTVSQTPVGPAQALITVQTTNGVVLQGLLNLLQVNFTTTAGLAPGSDFLQISNVIATLANGTPVPTAPDVAAQIIFTAPNILPPVLSSIADQTISVGQDLILTNQANESNLVFSLVASPTGMQIDPVTGILTWTPALAQAGSSNSVTVRVSDNNTPPLSASQTFNVIVSDVAQFDLGDTNVILGQTASLPISLFSSGPVTNLSFILDAPVGVSTVSIQSVSSGITISQWYMGPRKVIVNLQTTGGQSLQGQSSPLQINITATTNLLSNSGILQISTVVATLADGQLVTNAPDASSQIMFLTAAVTGAPATLDFQVSNGQGFLTVYGAAGNKYQILSTTNLNPAVWTNEFSVTLTNSTQTIGNFSITNGAVKYYRTRSL